ncbi:MAG TPA: hypothetical protein VKT77_01625 [Chthonomonadaceae bacterium]|nr:hypothetical protein [Chthonomonadaceae bacterium]
MLIAWSTKGWPGPRTHRLLRLRNPTRQDLRKRVAALFQTEMVEDWVGCFVVATDVKVRVRRPSAEPY